MENSIFCSHEFIFLRKLAFNGCEKKVDMSGRKQERKRNIQECNVEGLELPDKKRQPKAIKFHAKHFKGFFDSFFHFEAGTLNCISRLSSSCRPNHQCLPKNRKKNIKIFNVNRNSVKERINVFII